MISRSGLALATLLVAVTCVACDHFQAFYIQNETDDLYYVRVTIHRTGGVYVHRVEPRASGLAAQSLTDPTGEEVDTVELLDADCNPIEDWGMPMSGGFLRIGQEPQFVPGSYSEPVGSSGPGATTTHETVFECGATEIIPEP